MSIYEIYSKEQIKLFTAAVIAKQFLPDKPVLKKVILGEPMEGLAGKFFKTQDEMTNKVYYELMNLLESGKVYIPTNIEEEIKDCVNMGG